MHATIAVYILIEPLGTEGSSLLVLLFVLDVGRDEVVTVRVLGSQYLSVGGFQLRYNGLQDRGRLVRARPVYFNRLGLCHFVGGE